jgi:hypothetical protein
MLVYIQQSESARSFLRSPRRKMQRSHLLAIIGTEEQTVCSKQFRTPAAVCKVTSRRHVAGHALHAQDRPYHAFEMQGQRKSISTGNFECQRSPLYGFTPDRVSHNRGINHREESRRKYRGRLGLSGAMAP